MSLALYDTIKTVKASLTCRSKTSVRTAPQVRSPTHSPSRRTPSLGGTRSTSRTIWTRFRRSITSMNWSTPSWPKRRTPS